MKSPGFGKSVIIMSVTLVMIIGTASLRPVRTIFMNGLTSMRGTITSAVGSAIESDSKNPDQEVVQLQAEIASLLYLKQENELLRDAIETKNETGLTPLKAEVISFDNNFLRDTILVNVGQDQGVQENQPVIYLGHLVGVVTSVTADTSRIRLISDAESTVGVRIENEIQSEGVLKSSFGTEIFVDLVPKVESIQPGQAIFTSGVGGLPAGLVVGTVSQVNEGELFHEIIVDYPINLRRITNVFILK